MRTCFLIFMLMLASCSKKPVENQRQIKFVNFAAALADNFPGGIMLRLDGPLGRLEAELTEEPYNMVIPNGEWTFHVVAFAGPDPLVGPVKCASSGVVKLDGTDTEVNLDVVSSTCSQTVYGQMLRVNPVWNQGQWNKMKWRP